MIPSRCIRIGDNVAIERSDQSGNSARTRGLKPFRKGQSGNPGGRPKEYRAFKERCSEFMDSEGFEKLVALARDRNEFALRLMAEYAYGKPQQHVDVTTLGEQIKAYVGVDLDRV